MTKASKHMPRKVGFFIFRGARRIRNAMYEHLCEPVQILEVMNGGARELAVVMTGRASRFPLVNFEGEWVDLELGDAT